MTQPLTIQVITPEQFERIARMQRFRKAGFWVFLVPFAIALVMGFPTLATAVLLPVAFVGGVFYLVYGARIKGALSSDKALWMAIDESTVVVYHQPTVNTRQEIRRLEPAAVDAIHVNQRTYTISKSPSELTAATSQRGVQRNRLGFTINGQRLEYEVVMRSREEVESMLRILRSWRVPMRGH